MNPFLEQIEKEPIIVDGAMGTYYARKKQETNTIAEWANMEDPNSIVAIHKEYLEAGATLIRTNTFAANTVVMEIDEEKQKQLIREGYRLAKRAVEEYEQQQERAVYIAADLGPIPTHGETTKEEVQEEYIRICETFLKEGAEIFLFETFSEIEVLREVVSYVKKRKPEVCIITNFCINKNGYTMAGISGEKLLREVEQIEEIDICGFNCGIGSGHMVQFLQNITFPPNKKIAALPNAGYPEQMYSRMVFGTNIKYFAEKLEEMREMGVSLIGGCCGTTPAYIRAFAELHKPGNEETLNQGSPSKVPLNQIEQRKVTPSKGRSNQIEQGKVTPSRGLSNQIEQSKVTPSKGLLNQAEQSKIQTSKVPSNQIEPSKIQTSKPDYQQQRNQRIQSQKTFLDRLQSGKKMIAVELDPPYDHQDEKLMECVEAIKKTSADIVTIADSPMGRSRVDSVLMSLKITSQYGIPVMPHVCCRDKNMISMRSTLLGAYLNGIRNLLVVTGDPVPSEQRLSTTSVFDYNSIHLMQFIKQMNEEHFKEDPIVYGGALNPGLGRVEKIVERMERKIAVGAQYFLTQPVYDEAAMNNLEYIKEHVDTKILCGVMPFVSYRNANFIKNEFSGIHVPEEIVERYTPEMTKEEAENVGAQLGKELIQKLSPYADGYYFMLPFNRVSLFEKIEPFLQTL
ncbi:homocysteine S-methyltransferase family protein [Anaerosporobacter faecicola]|uniref:homocysteine S-methyltransferase family protein n=1 Tax=Anaerosporobacter faecicola TaxID=2718714 RepID=UPI00143A4F26|nr:homocysteine S-methyltransferase family protein [Anaerosporobacter faecicola]